MCGGGDTFLFSPRLAPISFAASALVAVFVCHVIGR